MPFSRYQGAIEATVVFDGLPNMESLAIYIQTQPRGWVAAASPMVLTSGTGYLVYPSFGLSTPNVIVDLLTGVLPNAVSGYSASSADRGWTDDRSLWLGPYARAMAAMEEAEARWDLEAAELRGAIDTAAADYQQRYLPLITSDADALKVAVIDALAYLGVGITDVDTQPNRDGPQEDLWLWDGGQARDPRDGPVVIAEVKGKTRAVKEDDVQTLSKYRVRRMSEWGHVNVRGILSANPHRNKLPSIRPQAFTGPMERDALRNHDLLMTGWDLYRLVQMVLSAQIAPEDARRSIFESEGVYSLSNAMPAEP
jgi:hypothetical protein